MPKRPGAIMQKFLFRFLTLSLMLCATMAAAAPEPGSIAGKYVFSDEEARARGEITILPSGPDTYAVTIHRQAQYPFYFYGSGKLSEDGILVVSNTCTHDKYKAKPRVSVAIYFKNNEDLEDYAATAEAPQFKNLQPGQIAILVGQDILDAISFYGAGGLRLPDGKPMFEKGGIPFNDVYTKEGITVTPDRQEAPPEPADPLEGLPVIPDSLNGQYAYADEEHMHSGVLRIQKTARNTYAVAIETRMRHHFASFYGTGELVADGVMLVANTLRFKEKTADFTLKLYLKNHPDLARYATENNLPDHKHLRPGQIAIPYDERRQTILDSLAADLHEQMRIRLPNGQLMFPGGAAGDFSGIFSKESPAAWAPTPEVGTGARPQPQPRQGLREITLVKEKKRISMENGYWVMYGVNGESIKIQAGDSSEAARKLVLLCTHEQYSCTVRVLVDDADVIQELIDVESDSPAAEFYKRTKSNTPPAMFPEPGGKKAPASPRAAAPPVVIPDPPAGARFAIVEPGKRYTFTGVLKKVKNNRKADIIALTENNANRNLSIQEVRYLKGNRAVPAYISKSLMDCIGNPDHPYDGPVEINCPVYLISDGWVLLMGKEGTCRRLPR